MYYLGVGVVGRVRRAGAGKEIFGIRVRGKENTVGVTRYTLAAFVSSGFEHTELHLLAIPMNLSRYALVRRCEFRQVPFP
jgi:hypothetical protein